MIFGFDFDNTLINYDKVFFKEALKENLISKKTKKEKINIKNTILKKKNLKAWQYLQSVVYSQKINYAVPNRELLSVLRLLKKKKIKYFVVSHKTKFPYFGKKINLHNISRKWLDKNIFNKKNNLKKCDYFFEETIPNKIKRIKKLKITHFVDDLKEIINLLPKGISGVLYKKGIFNIQLIKKLLK